jgi:hypothetical protein
MLEAIFLYFLHNPYTALYIYIYNLSQSHTLLPFCTQTLSTAVLRWVEELLDLLFVKAVGPAVVSFEYLATKHNKTSARF